MRALRGRRSLVVIALALIATGTTGQSAHAGGERPAAQVDISPFAKEMARGAILVHLHARCAPGNTVQELIVEYTQNGFTVAQPASTRFDCDGRWHRFSELSPEAFDPGPADVAVRLTIIDEVTGDPKPQAVDSQRVWVEPAAKVRISDPITLVRDGSIRVKVYVRCDQPWVDTNLYVEVGQGRAHGGLSLGNDFVECDDRWHRFVLSIPSTGDAFTRGPADVLAYFGVSDPESFDPVAQAQHIGTVRIRG